MSMTLSKIPNRLRGLAGLIRKHGTCAPATLEFIADEIDFAITAAPQPHEGERVLDAMDDFDPQSCLMIPDWALARAYRQAIDKFYPELRQSALVFSARVTAAAEYLAERFSREHCDYLKDPRTLAEWLRKHFRGSWDDPFKIPEITAIYDILLAAPTLAGKDE